VSATVLIAFLLLQTPAQRASRLVDAGVELSHQGRFAEAAEKFVQALALDPALAEAHYLMGLIRQQDRRPAAALESFRAALRINPRYAQAQARVCEIETLQAKARESGYETALASCRRAIALDPADPESYFHAGSIQSKLGQHAAAVQSFSAVLRRDPKFRHARYELAMAYIESQDPAQGIPLLREVVASEPSHGNARFQLGSALAKLGDCAGAVPHLEAATEAPQKYYLLSGCYKKLGRDADAASAMERVRQLREGSDARMQAKFLAAVAHQKAEAGRLGEAIVDYRAAYELTKDPGIAIDLAVALLRNGEAAEVVKLLEGAADPLARYQVALAYANLGRQAESRTILEETLRDRPGFAEAWYQLGIASLSLKDWTAAETALRTASGLRPDDPVFRTAWAEALDGLGRAGEARAQRSLASRLPK